MAFPSKPGVDWLDIRKRVMAGERPAHIAEIYPISRQAIIKKAQKEGWMLSADRDAVVQIAQRNTPDVAHTKLQIVDHLGKGASDQLVARIMRVPITTLKQWRQDDEAFDLACNQAAARWALRHIENVNKASDRGDARSAQWALERNPLTRQEYGPDRGEKPSLTVTLNIPPPPKPVDGGTLIEAIPVPMIENKG